MFLNRVSPGILYQNNDSDFSYRQSGSSASSMSTSDNNTQLSQFSQRSLDLFSQTPLNFESTSTGNIFTDGEKREPSIITDKTHAHYPPALHSTATGNGSKKFSKYYMRYISTQESLEKEKAAKDREAADRGSYQRWKNERKEIIERDSMIDEVVKVTEECKRQITSTTNDLSETLKTELKEQAKLNQQVSTEHIMELKELVSHNGLCTRQDFDKSSNELSVKIQGVNEKLTEVQCHCLAQTDKLAKLEGKLETFTVSFDQIFSLIDVLTNEVKRISRNQEQQRQETEMVDKFVQTDEDLSLTTLDFDQRSDCNALLNESEDNQHAISSTVDSLATDKKLNQAASGPYHVDKRTSLIGTCSSTEKSEGTVSANHQQTLSEKETGNDQRSSLQSNDAFHLVESFSPKKLATRRKRQQEQSRSSRGNESNQSAMADNKENIQTYHTTNKVKRFRTAASDSAKETAESPLRTHNEDSSFATSHSLTKAESFQRRTENSKRQALSKAMAPGSECLLKEIQSLLLVRRTNKN